MKKFLVIALVALLAVGSVFATDLKFSGRVRLNQTFDFSDTDTGVAKNAIGSNFSVSGASDYWKVTLASSSTAALASPNFTASVYVDKLLADKVNFGDAKVTLNLLGTQYNTYNVYANVRSNNAARFGVANGASVVVAYKDITVKAAYGVGTSLAYGAALADVVYNFKDSVKAQAAAGYDFDTKTLTAEASAICNIDKFVEVDGLKASASAFGKYDKAKNADYAKIAAGVTAKGSYNDISGYVEYTMDKAAVKDADIISGIYAEAQYKINDMFNAGCDLAISNLAKTSDVMTVAPYANISLGNGVSALVQPTIAIKDFKVSTLVRMNVAF